MKLCTLCNLTKSEENFSKASNSKDGLFYWCKGCASNRFRTWNEKTYTPQIGREQNLRKYGITPAEFDLLLEAPDFKCAICQKTGDKLKAYNRGQKFGVDHNHSTGKVRGLLCQECNRALGLFHEDKFALQTAIQYLNQ